MSKIVTAVVGVVETVAGVVFQQPWLTGLGVSTLLGDLAGLLSPKAATGVHTQIAYDPAYPRQLIVGRTKTSGSLVAKLTHDHLPTGGGDEGKNRVLELVIALADHECDGLEYILVDGQLVGVDLEGASAVTPAGSVVPTGANQRNAQLGWRVRYSIDPVTRQPGTDFTNALWIQFHNGADGQAADSWLTTALGAKWPATSVGTNVCYARVTCVYNPKVFSGEPRLEFVLRGAKLYDVRQDSTAGGSGAHRFGVPATYAFSENPCVIAYNLARGITAGGTLFYGASADAGELPFDSWTAAMNACDEAVALKAGGTEQRYRVGGQSAVNRDATSFLQAIAASMAGHFGTGGGAIVALPGVAASAATVISDDDIMAVEPYELAPKFGFEALKNAVFGEFLDPNQNWSLASLPERTSSADVATDGGIPIGDSYTFDMVHSHTQAQRVMEIIRRRNRRQIAHTITLRPGALAIERGDWIEWTSAQFGYNAKTFFALGSALGPNLDNTLNLIEIDSTIFDWTPANDELPVAGGLLPSAAPPATSVLTGITAIPLADIGGGGQMVPSLHIAYTDPQDSRATGVLVEYRIDGTTTSYFATGNVSGALVIPNLQPLTAYNYRLILQGVPGFDVDWSAWNTITTGTSQLPTTDESRIRALLATLTDIGSQLNDVAQALINQAATNIKSSGQVSQTLASATSTLSQQIVDGQSASAAAITNLQALLTNQINVVAANLTTESNARATADAANASSITTLNAALAGYTGANAVSNAFTTAAANLTAESNTRATADAANASSITALNSALNGYTGANAVATAIAGLVTTVNARNTVFVANAAPAANAIGDIWSNSTGGQSNALSFWNGAAWQSVPGLSGITVFAQNATPVATHLGDIWINTTGGKNIINRWDGTIWAVASDLSVSAASAFQLTLSSTVAGNTATISTLQSSVNGFAAQWGVSIDVNGHVTGLVRLDGGATQSSFTVIASSFNYFDPTAGTQPLFTITGGTAFFRAPLVAGLINAGTIIANNIISTSHMLANAVTQFGSWQPIAGAGVSQSSAGSTTFNVTHSATQATAMRDPATNLDYKDTGDTASQKIVFFSGQLVSQSGTTTNVTLHIDYGQNTTAWTNCPAGEANYRLSATPLTISFVLIGIVPTNFNLVRATVFTDNVDVTVKNAQIEYIIVKR